MNIIQIRRSFHEYKAAILGFQPLEYKEWELIIQEWTWKKAFASFVTRASILDIVIFTAVLAEWTAWLIDKWLACKSIHLLGD